MRRLIAFGSETECPTPQISRAVKRRLHLLVRQRRLISSIRRILAKGRHDIFIYPFDMPKVSKISLEFFSK